MAWCRLVWLHVAVVALCLPTAQAHGSPVSDDEDEGMSDAKDWYSCGDGLCTCQDTVANCSYVPGGLQYVPRLPSKILYLYFSYNILRSIPADFYHNVTRLIKADMSHNNLSTIHPHAFRFVRNLQYLYLSANLGLTYESLTPVLAISKLQELDLMSCALGPLPKDLFHNATLSRLSVLLLHDNELGDTALSTFTPLKALRELGLATNLIVNIKADAILRVEKINLDTNYLYQFPTTCNGTSSLFPHLKVLLMQGNSLSHIPKPVCLPHLQTIALGKNKFSRIGMGDFSAKWFPQLIIVSLFAMNTQLSQIESNAFSNPTVQRVDLSYNNIRFSSPGISSKSFADCPQLHSLDLAHNRMDVEEGKFLALFGHLRKVTFLDIQGSQLAHLSSRMLSSFCNLTILHLSLNQLRSLSDGLFEGLNHLQEVDFSQNQIAIVPPTVFTDDVRSRLQSVDLSGNPFSCSCGLLWFQDWLTANASIFRNSWTSYLCQNLPNITVQSFVLVPQACLWSHATYVFLDVTLSLLKVVLLLGFGLVRYRWHIRLWLFQACSEQGQHRRQHLQNNHFTYDVYVNYDQLDDAWVQCNLIPQLEERLGLRLCLPERDLDARRPELDTISESVEKSKKVLMLFSANFVQNQLCQFQLSMCLRHVLDYGDTLIIVCLDDVAPRDMTTAMLGVLKTTPYIQWAEEADAIMSFWGRLQIALQEVLPRPVPP